MCELESNDFTNGAPSTRAKKSSSVCGRRRNLVLPHPPPRQLIVHERGPCFLTLVPVRVEHVGLPRRPRAPPLRPSRHSSRSATSASSTSIGTPRRAPPRATLDRCSSARVLLALDDALDGRVIGASPARASPPPTRRHLQPSSERARRRRRRRRRRLSRALSTLAVLPRRSGRRRRLAVVVGGVGEDPELMRARLPGFYERDRRVRRHTAPRRAHAPKGGDGADDVARDVRAPRATSFERRGARRRTGALPLKM